MSNHLQAALHLSYFRVLKVDTAWNQTRAYCFKVRWRCYSVKVSKYVSLKLRLLQYLTVLQVPLVQKMDDVLSFCRQILRSILRTPNPPPTSLSQRSTTTSRIYITHFCCLCDVVKRKKRFSQSSKNFYLISRLNIFQ